MQQILIQDILPPSFLLFVLRKWNIDFSSLFLCLLWCSLQWVCPLLCCLFGSVCVLMPVCTCRVQCAACVCICEGNLESLCWSEREFVRLFVPHKILNSSGVTVCLNSWSFLCVCVCVSFLTGCFSGHYQC